jgi:hypothetical protein
MTMTLLITPSHQKSPKKRVGGVEAIFLHAQS